MSEDFFFHHGHRAGRGDLEPIILRLLSEKPMHGYEIIRTLEERSHGFWRPSPGSVYPILQFLEEQDLVMSQEQSGKKVYAITTKGREQAEEVMKPHSTNPFSERLRAGLRFRDMKESIRESVHYLREVAIHGDDSQIKAVKNIIQKAHDELRTVVDEIQNPNP
jgi:DNA-binding PadR family transcriptional regulator